jgi:hypothetical protein
MDAIFEVEEKLSIKFEKIKNLL